MDVEIITTTDGLDALKDEWEALERNDRAAPYYVTHRFVRAWWEAHAAQPGMELRIVTTRHNGSLVGIAPLSLRTEQRKNGEVKVLRFASHGDYMGFLVDPAENADSVLKKVMAAVHAPAEWDVLALTNIPTPSPLAGYLLRSEHNDSFSVHVENPRIGLRAYTDFDDFASQHLPSKVRKYRNKLLREREVTFRVIRGNDENVFDKIAALHRLEKRYLVEQKSRDERYSLFEIPERAQHVRRVFTDTNDAITFVYEDPQGEIVGYRTCYLHGRTLLSWNSAYHPDYLDYRIGKVIQYDVLQHLFEHDIADVFDFGAGRYPWKFEWTDDFTVSYRLQVRRKTADRPGPAGSPAAQEPGQPGNPTTDVPAPRQTPGPEAPASRRQKAKEMARKAGLGKAKLAALRARSAAVARFSRPVIWYAPHPDDETIFMGGSISAGSGRRNVLVMLTRGGGSGAIDLVNAKLETPLTREQFMAARLRELGAAVRALGIADEDFHIRDLPDGGLEEQAVLEVIREMARRYPRAEHRTMSYLDPHRDHATAGRALRTAYREGAVKSCTFHVPVPLVDESLGDPVILSSKAIEGKRAALREYELWRPAEGRYAIGAHSVKRLIKQQRQNPRERVHGPDYLG